MELIIFIGLQAAGKSTFFRAHFAATHDYVSKDLLRASKHASKTVKQNVLVENALQADHSVVIDNTNLAREDRASLIQLGHLYSAEIIGYYFDAPVRQCITRNKQRTGKARVPDVAIYAAVKRLVPPIYEEGFDKLFTVSLLPQIADNSGDTQQQAEIVISALYEIPKDRKSNI